MKSAISELYQEELYKIDNVVVVVLPRTWHEILPDEKALLAKILGSVKVSIESVVVQTFTELRADKVSSLNPGKVLVFGVPVKPELKTYECVKVDGIMWIAADDLSRLDDAKKKSLWVALKQMFGL